MKTFRLDYILFGIGAIMLTAGMGACTEQALSYADSSRMMGYGILFLILGWVMNLFFYENDK